MTNRKIYPYLNSEIPRNLEISLVLFVLLQYVTTYLLLILLLFCIFTKIVLFRIGLVNLPLQGLGYIFIVMDTIVIFFILYNMFKGAVKIKYLRYGKMTFAKLIGKTVETREWMEQNTEYITMKYEYYVNKNMYFHTYNPNINKTEHLEEQVDIPILYISEKPEKATIINTIDNQIYISSDGDFVLKDRNIGYKILTVDVILITIIVYISII